MRARLPDRAGTVERDGVALGFEVHGDEHAGPAIVLMPTWTIIHSRFWKFQVPHLARRHRVIVYDGPGNGNADRVTDPARYAPSEYAADAAAVLDACGVERAVAVGLSRGAWYALELAALRPDSIAGLVLVGPSLPIAAPLPQRAGVAERFLDPAPDPPTGWDRYNLDYWHQHYGEFTEWFFGEAFSEPHSTKALEDAVRWAAETGPDVLQAEAFHPAPGRDVTEMLTDLRCPTLVVHGDDDRIVSHAVGVEAARLSGGTLVTFAGSGHIPNLRDPVRFNQLLDEFVAQVAGTPPRARPWTRGASRRAKLLYLSSPIGLGHARRDLAIVQELRRERPDVEIEWLAQEPVTTVLARAGETIHPASAWLASESGHIASEACGHDLHCFQALRRMDEILVANFMIFQEVVDEGLHDLVVGDEAWDVDHFWHENPELKRGSHVWMTDFVGFLPMPDGGDREAFLTADYNAEMVEHIARFPRIRDRSIFVGNPDDIVPGSFGPGLPDIRGWTEQHFDFSGYITGFEHPTPDQIAEWRHHLGYRDGEPICVVTVGGSGVGHDLLELAIAAHDLARREVDGLRTIVVTGPRIDPDRFPRHPGLEIHGYVDRLYRHLAACDLAVVQGGLTTTMELTAARTPFVYFPLAHHFEQNFHVRHRLDRYGAGICMDHATTDPEQLAAVIAATIGTDSAARPVETDGARRAAQLIGELL